MVFSEMMEKLKSRALTLNLTHRISPIKKLDTYSKVVAEDLSIITSKRQFIKQIQEEINLSDAWLENYLELNSQLLYGWSWMKWMPPPRICLQLSASYSLAALVLFLGEFCHRNLLTGWWITWRLCLPGLAAWLQMWQLGWHWCMALPRVSSGHWLAVENSSWSKGQLCFTVHFKYPLIVYLARVAHLRWHQFTLSTEPHAGTWHLALLSSDPSYSPQNGSSFFISQKFCL